MDVLMSLTLNDIDMYKTHEDEIRLITLREQMKVSIRGTIRANEILYNSNQNDEHLKEIVKLKELLSQMN